MFHVFIGKIKNLNLLQQLVLVDSWEKNGKLCKRFTPVTWNINIVNHARV